MVRPKFIYKQCQKIVFVCSLLIIVWLYVKKERSLTAAHKRAKIPAGEFKYRSGHAQGDIFQQQQQPANYFAFLQQQQQQEQHYQQQQLQQQQQQQFQQQRLQQQQFQQQQLQQQQQFQQQQHYQQPQQPFFQLPFNNFPRPYNPVQVVNQVPLQNDFRNQFAGQAPNQPVGIQNPLQLNGPVQPVNQNVQPANVFVQPNAGAMANKLALAAAPEFEIVASAKNVTPHDARLLVYNRVPKCGSTTVLDILNLTARMNKYWYRHSLLYNEMNLTSAQQRMVLTHLGVQNWETPISYDRHMYYVDFAKQGNSRVAWMNIIRDPVERIISEFYFIRVKSRWDTIESLKKISHRKPPDSWFEMTLDECVPAKHPECYPKFGQYMRMQLTFLCGTDPVCSQVGNRKALQLAKMHVERQYSVVGTLEEFPLTLRVLEAYLPRFFRGVTSLEHSSGNVKKNVGEYKPSVSEETKMTLRALLKEDVELYEFVRQRLFLQAEAIAKTER